MKGPKARGLSPLQLDLLDSLKDADEMTVRQLAADCGTDAGTVRVSLKGLHQRGMVARRNEGRVGHWSITDAGRQAYQDDIERGRVPGVSEKDTRHTVRRRDRPAKAPRAGFAITWPK